jgi:outer membrane protein
MHIGKTTLRIFFLPVLLSVASMTQAQEIWSLQKCIEYARDNSLTLKQAMYNVEIAKLTDKANRLARLPNLNGSSSGGISFGRTIDPVTNNFLNQKFSYNSFGLTAGVLLYNGGRINSTIKQGAADVKATEADAAYSFNVAALNIANAYLQILMSEEQLENGIKRKELSTRQLEQTDKFIQAGTLPANDRLDVLAQIARDEQTIIQSQNSIDIGYLNLKELMQLDPIADIKVERPAFVIPADANPDALSFWRVYNAALGTQPQIKADEYRLESANTGVELARSALFPTLSVFGGIDTRWSSASRTVSSTTPGIQEQTIFIDETPVTVGFPVDIPIFDEIPYTDQLDQNFGQNVGFSLSVPIYNNGRNSINVERARIGILNARVQTDQTKLQLKSEVQQAIANVRASRRTLEASEKSVAATRAAFENDEKRFNLGAINTLQFTTARNNLDIAETDLIASKYDYLFRLKIIDFYLGLELKLD